MPEHSSVRLSNPSRLGTLLVACILLFLTPAALAAAEDENLSAPFTEDGDSAANRFTVRCDSGHSISRALRFFRFFRQVTIDFSGSCDEDIVIERDHVTLRGVSEDATILGLIDVFGGSNITLEDFTILGEISDPVDTGRGAINVVNGGAITVNNVHLQTQNVRGVRIINSTAALNNVSVDDILVGGFVFRASSITFSGEIVATRSVFGMTFVDSNGNARNANFTFNDNFFAGLIVQINSGFEHVEGLISANNNPFGLFIASNAVLAHGSFIEVSGSSTAGVLVDEFSSLTPLAGAPGGGPGLTLTDNPGDGIVLDRYSTLETLTAEITGNATGVSALNSEVRLAASTVEGNTTEISLGFDSKLTGNGEENVIGGAIECDSSVLTRGTLSCSAPALSSTTPSTRFDRDLTIEGSRGELPTSTLIGVMGRLLRSNR